MSRLEIEPPLASRHRSTAATARRGAPQRLSLGIAPLLALVAAGGLLMVALGNNAARSGGSEAQFLFWGGLVAIFAPVSIRLFSAAASREERLALSILLGASLFVVKVLYDPTGFTLHDELATWRQTSDLLASGHTFTDNPIVGGYTGFPALSLVTAAICDLTGASIFVAGSILIGVARIALMVALFLFLERTSRSARVAGIAIAIYACNPSFLYFDSQFGYESLALPIGGALLLLTLRWTEAEAAERSRNAAGLVGAMAVLACTLATTHHMTTYAMIGFLATWTLTVILTEDGATGATNRRLLWLDGPALPGVILAAAGAIWFVFVAGDVTTDELGGVFADAVKSVIDLIVGDSGSKPLFQAGGQTNTTAARILGIASIVPLLVIIPLGLWRTWRRPDPNALWRALSIVALFYPATLLLRLTQAGTETSQRASEFVFVGLAFVGALLLSELTWPRQRMHRLATGIALASLATVIFLGGFIVGESPATRQPGPFVVGGEARAVSPQGVAAAKFADEELPTNGRVIVDRPNSTLMASYGHLDYVTGGIDGIPVHRVFFSPSFDAVDQKVISDDAIDYIVVDRRLTHETPVGGYYFERSEPLANDYREPIDVGALRKFNHVRGLSRIFDNGAIAIYDTSGLRSR